MLSTVILAAATLSLSWILLPVAADFLLVILAVAVDLVSGCRASRRAGSRLSSSGFRRSVSKLTTYLLTLFALCLVDGLVIVSALCLRSDMGWAIPVFPFLSTVGAFCLCIIEVKSVIENCHGSVDMKSILRSAARVASDDDLRSLIGALTAILHSDQPQQKQ